MDLSDDWRISADPRNFILERRTAVTNRVTGETTYPYKVHGYYPSVAAMGRAISTVVARESIEAATYAQFETVYMKATAWVTIHAQQAADQLADQPTT